MIVVEAVSERTREAYGSYVAAHPQARFGHDLEWARALQATYGLDLEHLIATDDDQTVGVCPLFLCQPRSGGGHYQTSVFPSYFGPLFDSEPVLDRILETIVRKSSDSHYAEILAPEPLPADERLPFVEQLDHTYRLPLEAGPARLFAGFRRNYRRILNDPEFHKNVTIVVDTDGSLVPEFHRPYARLYARKHGFIPHVEALFRNIYAHYRNGSVRTYLARRGDTYIGGIFTFWRHAEVYCAWSAMDLTTEYRPMHFLIWQIIQDAAAEGYRWFNHGEAQKDNKSLNLFKQGWGMQVSYPCRYFIPGRQSRPVERLFDRFSWTQKVIAHLPPGLTSSLLSPLIRYFL